MFILGNRVVLPLQLLLLSVVLVPYVVASSSDLPNCYGNSSLHCLSTKLIAAFRKIDNIPEIPVTTWLSVVPAPRSNESELLLQPPSSESRNHRQGLLLVLGKAINDFIESRNIRIALPEWATGSSQSVDLDVGRAFTQVTGRKGGKKGGMGMMSMVFMGKMMMMAMGMMHMKAFAGMMAGGMALTMSMMTLMGMAMSKKGGHGGQTKHVVVVTHGPAGPGPSSAPPANSYGAPPADTYGAPPPGNDGWNNGGGAGGWNSGGHGRVGGYYYGGYPTGWGNRAYYYEPEHAGLPMNNSLV